MKPLPLQIKWQLLNDMKKFGTVSFLLLIFFAQTFAQVKENNVSTSNYKNDRIGKTQYQTLPVELIYFYGLVESNGVLLKWGTATEVNNFGFEIERANSSMADWETIDFVLGNGTSNIPIDYDYLDSTVDMSGIAYYRLKQIDIIGSFEYSDTVSIDFLSSITLESSIIPSQFSISNNYPNPFNPVTHINFELPYLQFLKINMFDITGKLVKEIVSQEFLPGIYQLYLDFSNYSSGIYFVRFESQKNIITKKITFLK
ncbi:MAG: T9SS type A sorting domain-containing protein [Ignavibacteriota bacterium]